MHTEQSERDWRDLSYDVGWEAAPHGAIHCKRVLNRRDDIFKAVEGLHPRLLFCESRGKSLEALLQDGHRLRHLDVCLPFGPERLYVTAQPLPGGGAIGTFCAIAPQGDTIMLSRMALLSHIAQARGREEVYRREAETMLGGLRLLLGDLPANEKLDALAALMMKAIHGTARLILHRASDGTVHVLAGRAARAPDGRKLAPLFADDAPVALYPADAPRAAMLRALLGMRGGAVAAILLPVKAQSVLLLCAARHGFRSETLDFARRFALLLEQALLFKDEQARALQAAKLSALGQMAASLAHELCQPLNTISVTAQNLEMLAEAGPVAHDVLRRKIPRILSQVERAGRIMDRMRRFARKSGGVYAVCDIAALADGVRILLEHLLTPAGITLTLDIAAGLSVRCDAVGIEQVLVNLVRNAIDALSGIGTMAPAAAHAGGRIVIRGRAVPHGIILSVEDNGPGFPPDIEQRPPESFFTTKSADQGTGLGLSICHTIARAHGGVLKLGNHAGGGFARLELPERAP